MLTGLAVIRSAYRPVQAGGQGGTGVADPGVCQDGAVEGSYVRLLPLALLFTGLAGSGAVAKSDAVAGSTHPGP